MPNYNNRSKRSADDDFGGDEEETVAPTAVKGSLETTATDVNLEDAFGKLFKSSVSGTGEEELLRIASDYALQINAKQIKCLLYLVHWADKMNEIGAKQTKPELKSYYFWQGKTLGEFVYKWLDWKKHNNSDVFVMRALDSISLRKFINENTLKVNIEK